MDNRQHADVLLVTLILLFVVEQTGGCQNTFALAVDTQLISTEYTTLPVPGDGSACYAVCIKTPTCRAYTVTPYGHECSIYVTAFNMQYNIGYRAYIRNGCDSGCSSSNYDIMENTRLDDGESRYIEGVSTSACRDQCTSNPKCRAYRIEKANSHCLHFMRYNSVHNVGYTSYDRAWCAPECTTGGYPLPNTQLMGPDYTLKTGVSGNSCWYSCQSDPKCVAYMTRKGWDCFMYYSVNSTQPSSPAGYFNSIGIRRCYDCPYTYSVSNNTRVVGTLLVDWGNQTLHGDTCNDKCSVDGNCVALSIKNSDKSCISYSDYQLVEDDEYTSYVLDACDLTCKTKFVPLTIKLLTFNNGYSCGDLTSMDACQSQCLNDPSCVAMTWRAQGSLCFIHIVYTGITTSDNVVSFNITRCTYHDGNWGAWSYSSCSVTCGHGVSTMTRVCNNPAPTPGKGQNCVGDATDSATCVQQRCPPASDAQSISTGHY